jgi:hypothetical protein
MDYQITYTLQTAYMTPGENQVLVFLDKGEAFEWFRNERREAAKYFGKVDEVYNDYEYSEDVNLEWIDDEVNLKWLDEVGPQELAEYYAQYKDQTILVRLEAHLNYIKKS